MGIYFIREILTIMHIVLTLFRFLHNFRNTDPFLMIFAPLESSHSQLSNGTKLIKNGSILRKLWVNQVGRSFHPEIGAPIRVPYFCYLLARESVYMFHPRPRGM